MRGWKCFGITESPEGEGDELRGGDQRDAKATGRTPFGFIFQQSHFLLSYRNDDTSVGLPSGMVHALHMCCNSTFECAMPS